MEVTVGLFLLLVILAFICEYIDSSLGMGYGTILAPVLIIMGFPPLVAIPALLLSQAFGGFTASVFHQQFKNVSFNFNSKDFKIFLIISGFGILATIFAAIIAINLPKKALQTYIGALVVVMGVIVLLNRRYKFSWNKMVGLGIVSAFNKGISGGGFGPVVTAGQIIAGQGPKAAIGVTTLAEAPICLVGFFTYLIGRAATEMSSPILNVPVKEFLVKMFSPQMFNWELMLALALGSVSVAPFGAFTTKQLDHSKINFMLGPLIIALGAWALTKTYF